MHAYCRRTLAPLLKQRQNVASEHQPATLTRSQQEYCAPSAGSVSQSYLNPQASVYNPPLILPAQTAQPSGDFNSDIDDDDTIVYDVPKVSVIQRERVRTRTRTRTRTVTFWPFIRNIQSQNQQVQDIQNHSRQISVSRAVIQPPNKARPAVPWAPPISRPQPQPRTEEEELQDCEQLATSVAEWLYRGDCDEPSEDPYDDQVLDFLSPDLVMAEGSMHEATPTLTSPKLVPSHNALRPHLHPIVQMIPNSPIEQHIPFDLRYSFEAAHRSLIHPDSQAPGIAVRYRIPTAGYVPPATYTRARPLPVPIPEGLVSGAGMNDMTASESHQRMRQEARMLQMFFGATLGQA